MKDDERWFLGQCRERVGEYCRPVGGGEGLTPRSLINEPGFPLPYKRAWYLLGKWTGKGWYEYGVTLDLGWMTPEGMKAPLG